MSGTAELLARLRQPEDNFTERKSEGAASRAELRKTLVAFANSVPEGRTAVLYIGVGDDGTPTGMSNPDSLQKTVQDVCRGECYPPLECPSEVLRIDGESVVAVVVSFSRTRPHFSGPAYVRRGSQSIAASEEMFQELVTSRLDKCREITKWKDKVITVVARGKALGSTKMLGDKHYRAVHECQVVACEAHYVRLLDINTRTYLSEPLENIKLARDEKRYRLMLIVEEA